MISVFNYPTRIVFGIDALLRLPEELSALGAKKVLIFTDEGLMNHTDIPARVEEMLKKGGFGVSIFPWVKPNPDLITVENGVTQYTEGDFDSIVALGGGSVMDTAKGVAIRVNHSDIPLYKFDDNLDGYKLVKNPVPPIVAIPTTSGTGSEVSRSAVITIEHRKTIIFSPKLMPSVAICDPSLTFSLPPGLTAETGIDALSHNLEAYIAKGFHPMADAIAIRGISYVARFLKRAFDNGKDEEARTYMMMASTMGAVAFQKGLGLIHAIAHAVSGITDLSHGKAISIITPYALKFNKDVVSERLVEIGEAFGIKDGTPDDAISKITELIESLGLPLKLKDAGVKEEDIEKIVDTALKDGSLVTNPKECEREDIEKVVREAF